MKKILLSMSACVIAFGTMNAQKKESSLIAPTKLENATIKAFPKSPVPTKKTRGGSIFINYADFLAANEGISSTDLSDRGGLYYLFPDSNMRYNPPNQGFGMPYKSIGQVLDPVAQAVVDNTPDGEIYFQNFNGYTVDSIFVLGSYAKVTSAVDTMVMSIVHSGGNNLPQFFFTGQTADFLVDTTRFLAQIYNPANFTSNPVQTNATGAPAAYTVVRPLTAADSSDYTMGESSYGLKYMGFSANNFAVPAGEKVSVSFTFKPGFTYASGDSIGKNNKYLFLSYEPKGDNTFMPYYPGDNNMSSVVHKDSTGWGGFYIPTLAWTQGYSPEIHDIVWKLTCSTCYPVNVDDVNSNITEVNVYPNPTSNEANFAFTLKESAKNASIEITNVMGQVVKTKNLTNITANTEVNATISVADLSAGLYIYTINANGQKLSNKLMVK